MQLSREKSMPGILAGKGRRNGLRKSSVTGMRSRSNGMVGVTNRLANGLHHVWQSSVQTFSIGSRSMSESTMQDKIPVRLLDLLGALPPAEGPRITLGLADNRQPLVLNLLNRQMSNVLVTGNRGAGKTTLMRTVAASIAIENRQSAIQLGMLELERGTRYGQNSKRMPAANNLPHCIFPVIRSVDGAVDVVHFLTTEVRYRLDNDVLTPLLVILFDDVDKLLAAGNSAVQRKLNFLLKKGPDTGLRIFLGLTDPIAPHVRSLLKHDFPLRLVGKMADADRTWAASGIPDTGAEHLDGKGDFVAVSRGIVRRFQSAYIGYDELGKVSAQLAYKRQPSLLARLAPEAGERVSMPGKQVVKQTNGDISISGEDIKSPANGKTGPTLNFNAGNGVDNWFEDDWL